jgi:hypothetical protein
MTTRAVELLRQPAGSFLLIPEMDPADGPYSLGLKPGSYRLTEVAHVVSFVVDILEV